jgi:hypothetical protein
LAGYGDREPTPECVEAVIALSVHCILGCLIEATMVGLVFSKLSMPERQPHTIAFSQNAVVNQQDRKLNLVRNSPRSYILVSVDSP